MTRPTAHTEVRQVACTICAKNYLHFARTLMNSVAEHHPDWDRVVLLVDRIDGAFDPAEENFRVIEVADLDLPDPGAFCFRYSILELNTAAKPWLLHRLVRDGYERVVYLDPDIRLYAPLVELQRELDEGGFCVLTPHLTGPLGDGKLPGEPQILISGSYNLGFIALQRHPSLIPFLEWWEDRLERDCVVDVPNGLFVDQKWIDLVPGVFPGARILRHEGYNVAYWNLNHRTVEPGGGSWTVNGVPLRFFHFSGLDPSDPEPFSKHQNRFRLSTLGPLRPLVEEYCAAVLGNGAETCSRWAWSLRSFDDGTPIPDVLRRYLRNHEDIESRTPGNNPYAMDPAFFNRPWSETGEGDPILTHVMRAVWEYHRDLQIAFPDPDDEHRDRFAEWFVEGRGLGYELDAFWVAPVRESVRRVHDGRDHAAAPSALLARVRRVGKRLLSTGAKRRIRRLIGPPRPTDGLLMKFLRPWGAVLPGGLKRRVRRFVNPPPPGAGSAPTVPLRLPHAAPHRGFHGGDATMRAAGRAWLGRRAVIRLPGTPASTVRVTGQYVQEPMTRAGFPPLLEVEFLMDQRSLGKRSVEADGPFEWAVPVEAAGDGTQLELRASHAFVPAEIGLGDDDRALSLQIARIDWDDTALVDFSENGSAGPDEVRAGLNIVGYFRAEMGVGESARVCAEAAEAAGVRTTLLDFRGGCRSRHGDDRLTARLATVPGHDTNLFHVNADQMPRVTEELGEELFAGRYNIGYWAWELPEFPDEWTDRFAMVDEVWTPSRFCTEAVAAKSPVPVLTMPHSVDPTPPAAVDRSRFGLPEDRFLWLLMWDMRSFRARKNPDGALRAFRSAFPDGREAGLVIKTMGVQDAAADWRELEAALRDIPGVTIITETLDRNDVLQLQAACDGFLSLHRSEGFGLGIAECMALGKPVVATGWSGNMDFMDASCSFPVPFRLTELTEDHGPYRRGQTWAEPDEQAAAEILGRVARDPDLARRVGEAAQRRIRERLSRPVVGQRYADRLEVLRRTRIT